MESDSNMWVAVIIATVCRAEVLQLSPLSTESASGHYSLAHWRPILADRTSFTLSFWLLALSSVSDTTSILRISNTNHAVLQVCIAPPFTLTLLSLATSGEEIAESHVTFFALKWNRVLLLLSRSTQTVTLAVAAQGHSLLSAPQIPLTARLAEAVSTANCVVDIEASQSFRSAEARVELDRDQELESSLHINEEFPESKGSFRLLREEWSLQPEKWHFHAGIYADFGISGWFFFTDSQENVQLLRLSSGDMAHTCNSVSLQFIHPSSIFLCIQAGKQTFCLPFLAVALRQWTLITFSYIFPTIELCSATLWSDSVSCVSDSVGEMIGSSGDLRLESIDIPLVGECSLRSAVSLYHRLSSDSAARILEDMETRCVSSCPLLVSSPSCASRVARSLAVTHYSLITFRQFMVVSDNHYFTFVNNHSATVSILFIGDNLGTPNADPDIYIYKPWNGDPNAADWQSTTWLTSSYTLLSTDVKLPAKGGIMGLYTFRVYGWNGGWTYEARVKIACSSTSLASCTCPLGSYPNLDTASCTTCPSDNACQIYRDMGCLPYSVTTSPPTGTFNCNNCVPGMYLQITTGTCLSCDSTCASCLGPASNQCVTCKANANLSGSIGTSSCICSNAFYPNLTAANCAACHASCATCQNSSDTDCLTCIAPATIAAAPGSCVCPNGYYPSPDARLCPSCDSHCVLCVGGTATHCTACKANASRSDTTTTSSSCVCDPGFYGDSANCQTCDPSCKTCSAAGTTGCTTCFSHASAASPPSACLCDPSFFPAPTSALCQACEASCLLCVGGSSTQCSSCHSGAFLADSAPVSRCVCVSHSFANPTTASCAPCHGTCQECGGNTQFDCLSCFNFALLRGTVSGPCDCVEGAFPSPDTSNCVQCDATCRTCIGVGTTKCMNCKPGAALTGPSPNTCQCSTGFFPSPDASICANCPPLCLTCENYTTCLSCRTSSVLQEGSCVCPEGFFGTTECIACSDGCRTCSELSCQQCLQAFFFLNGNCWSECPYGYTSRSDFTCVEVDLTPAVPSLSATVDNQLSLFFSKEVNIANLTMSDITIIVTDPDGIEIPISWEDPKPSDSQSCLIPVTYEVASIPSGTSATLTLLIALTDVWGVEVTERTVSTFLHEYTGTQSVLNTPAAASASTAASGGTVASASMSLFSGNIGMLTTLVNQMQLISYIGMTKIDLPQDFKATLAALNMGFVLASPFASRLPKTEKTEERPQEHVVAYGIDTFLFLENAMTVLGTAVGVLLSYIPIYLLSRVSSPMISQYFQKLLPSLLWDTPMKLWLTAYLDLGVFSFLQVTHAGDSLRTGGLQANLVFGLLFSFAVLSTPFLIWSFVSRNFEMLTTRTDSGFVRRWGTLLNEFKLDSHPSRLFFYLLFTARRLLFLLSLTVTGDWPGFIVVVNCVQSGVTLAYYAITAPFALKVEQVSAVVNEASVLLVYLSVFCFLFDLDSVSSRVISEVGIWITKFALFVNLAFSLFRTAVTVTWLLKVYAKTVTLHSKKTSLRSIARRENQQTTFEL